MDIVKIIGIGLVGTISSALVKEAKPSLAIGISMVTAMVIFVYVISALDYSISVIKNICDRVEIDPQTIGAVIKMTGVSYLAEFGAGVCLDAGERAIASKIELAGKVIIVTLSIPVLVSLLNLLISILP